MVRHYVYYLSLLLLFYLLISEQKPYITFGEVTLNEQNDEPQKSIPFNQKEIIGDYMDEQGKSTLSETKEKHEFMAEVTRLMDIIINSLYTKKEVFLRELISNAADALEKQRFLDLSSNVTKVDIRLEVKIDYDKEAKTLSITDTGIGMTKQDLINNLGTVAKSGTSNFLESLAQGGDMNLIGQFGVGFYAAFLVADKVTVTTKHNDDTQYIWESSADGSYTVAKDPRGSTIERGTRVTLHLKDDATEFLKQDKLKKLASNYGKFISYPIYLRVEKTVTEEVPIEEEAEKKEEDIDVKDEKEVEEKKTKKVEKKVLEWELVNPDKAIWLKPKEEVSEEEYYDFYKSTMNDYTNPLIYIHFTAEGEIEFKALLFIPSKAPSDMYENYFSAQKSNLKLYVRRAFVGDKFEKLLPKYLNFVKGVISSDDLPLNVSREQLQQHKLLPMLQKKLTKKVLEVIRKALNDSEAHKKQLKDALAQETDEEKRKDLQKKLNSPTKFDNFWSEFSRNMKLGCYDDHDNKSRLAKILRFYSSHSGNELITLDRYVANIKEANSSQNVIYYASGDSRTSLMNAPSFQIFKKKNLEVLFLLETMDEPCIQKLTEYENLRFVSIMKGDVNLELGDEDRKRGKKLNIMYAPLLTFMQTELSPKVQKVVISNRLVTDPCVVVSSQWGYSAQMEKIMKTQTFADPAQVQMMANQKIFEINPDHPVMINLLEKVKADKNDSSAKATVATLFQAAMLASGFDIEDPAKLASTIYKFASQNIGIDPNAKVESVNVDDINLEENEKNESEKPISDFSVNYGDDEDDKSKNQSEEAETEEAETEKDETEKGETEKGETEKDEL